MSRLPAVKPRQLIRALEREGFRVVRQSGSHVVLRREDPRRRVTVPVHSRDIPTGTLHGILRDAGISPERFRTLLRGRR